MRLTDLEPQFIRYVLERDVPMEIACDPANYPAGGTRTELRDRETWHHVDTIQEAQGVRFLCPVCFVRNAGSVGTHGVACWSRSRGVPDSATPGPGRWLLEGTGLHDLTLNGDGGSRSVLLTGGGCAAHFFVTNGEIQIC